MRRGRRPSLPILALPCAQVCVCRDATVHAAPPRQERCVQALSWMQRALDVDY
ncbi:hypothetical protein PR003_g10002 [Phytophthora rubi]|uniref:Uncharacterized protein n=1 Tax=Phytophthora rubi TaxID=129364 RepID=A0A6A3N0C0_9STRA|nr:hypothetical protein PR002_g9972 [Phytophthora rubi]KAE9035034.1 hypothetical protein PR001_g9479 [Phytophthora rubi]KAE9341407.1 hypothetical protein PR003_g10002 [Phytophthora rubi]